MFFFSHKLIWAVNNPRYSSVLKHVNSRRNYRNGSNFYEAILPVLSPLSQSKAVYWISGDIGVSRSLPVFSDRDPHSNITFLAAGLGDRARDRLLSVTVKKNGAVHVVPISLAGRSAESIAAYGVDYWDAHYRQPQGEGSPHTETQVLLAWGRPFGCMLCGLLCVCDALSVAC